MNGFDNYTRLVLNESNNYFEQYRPELTSFSPQFSEEVINSVIPQGLLEIFPNYILDRKLSTGGDGENRRHVLSINVKI